MGKMFLIGSPQRTDTQPYMRTFLQFDTREFLNVLSMAFGNEHFQTPWGRHAAGQFVDIITTLALEYADKEQQASSSSPPLTDIHTLDLGAFIPFIARCIDGSVDVRCV